MDQTHEFVETVTNGRDISHGYDHMLSVANLAQQYAVSIGLNDEMIELAYICGMLHDVAYHKYDKEGKLHKVLDEFVHDYFPDHKNDIMLVIDTISYSKERDMGLGYYEELYKHHPELLLVRHCVSDADKMQAIGKIGFIRCWHYTGKKYPTLTSEEKLQHVIEHAADKLLLLGTRYMHTHLARKQALKKNIELMEEIISYSKMIKTKVDAATIAV